MSERHDEILHGVIGEVGHGDWTYHFSSSTDVDEDAIVNLVMRHVDPLLKEVEDSNTVWVVTYGGYTHGIFRSKEKAEEYTARRWVKPPSNWKIDPWSMDKGAFDPQDEENPNV